MGRGKRRQVQQSFRQGCCQHAQTHTHTHTQTTLRQKNLTEESDLRKVQFICVLLAAENVPWLDLINVLRWSRSAGGFFSGKFVGLLTFWLSPGGVACFLGRRRAARLAGRFKDGEAVKQGQGADPRQLGQLGQEQSSPWRHHVLQVMFYTPSTDQVDYTLQSSCHTKLFAHNK